MILFIQINFNKINKIFDLLEYIGYNIFIQNNKNEKDVFYGKSGILFALLYYYFKTNSRESLDIAVRLADKLCEGSVGETNLSGLYDAFYKSMGEAMGSCWI